VLASTAFALLVPTANAAFTSPTLVSGTQLIPFEAAGSPALSANGRYVVFQGTLAGVPGIYRRDLQTGGVDMVVGSSEDKAIDAPDAAAPSVSADGRYIAFTSAAVLDPVEDRGSGCPQVYVRDMQANPNEPSITLASAMNGNSSGLTFASPCAASSTGRLALGGAQAAAAVALSADGRQVAFTVLGPSDLTGPCTPSTTPPQLTCPTPASQVAVRNLDTRTTTLVSATPSGEATPGGGAFPSTESEQKNLGSIDTTGSQPAGSTAAISADGSTVAWLGTNIPAQVPPATDVAAGMVNLGGSIATEVEPLWRRVADGSAAVTKRLLVGAGLNFYFTGSHEEIEAVNGGTLYPATQDFVPPALSADGTTVVTVADATTSGNEASYQYLGSQQAPPAEAYAIRVGDVGAPWVTPLTATPSFAAPNAILDGVLDVAISPDGSRVAFETPRTSFALAPPTLVSPPAPEVGNAYTYQANLALGTLQRVTSTYDGSGPTGPSTLISFSGDGLGLAFASAAGNLIYGDPTPGASQVYIVREISTATQVATPTVGPVPLPALPVPAWVLSATTVAQPDGSVLVDAQVPGAGRLSVRATTQISTSVAGHAARRRSRRRARQKAARASLASHARRSLAQMGTRTGSGSAITARTLASAGVVTAAPSELRLRLRASARYRSLITGGNGLYAILRVTFTASAHKTLVQMIPVTFRARVRSVKKVKR
jgi:Tol biopolymer transport system component